MARRNAWKHTNMNEKIDIRLRDDVNRIPFHNLMFFTIRRLISSQHP